MDIDDIVGPAVRGYLACALWLTTDEEGGSVDHLSLTDIDPAFETEAREDVTDFVLGNQDDVRAYVEARAGESVAEYSGQTYLDWVSGSLGHDFWLTRNGHGAGFWDRGLGELGDRLTAASKPYGETSTILQDDGKVGAL